MHSRTRQALALLLTGGVLAACAASEQPPADSTAAAPAAAAAPGAAMPVVEVSAMDFAFQMPDTIQSGVVNFRMVDTGTEPHHLMIMRIDGGHTVDEAMQAMQAVEKGEGPPPAWLTFVGGPNSPTPGSGEASEAAVDMQPGSYVAICLIPSTDGVPHVAKGMTKTFTVVPATVPAVAPTADLTMTLVDYAYPVDNAITAGRRIIKVENTAQQPHEVVFVKLEPGKKAEDVMAWEMGGRQGPPPGRMVAGTAPMGPGAVNYVSYDFTPGEYGLLCFVPAPDGKPHIAHGMIQTITVE